MPLTIIKGPPNSGRTEEVRREYIERLPRKPVLVVPSVDDIFDWEKRLARERGAFLGGRIMHFKDLVTEVLDREPDARPKVATALQRRHLIKLAFSEAWPSLGPRVTRQPGLIDSMLRLIDEFRQGLVDPSTVEEKAREIESGYVDSIVAVYRHFLEGLDERNLTDDPALAMAAVKVNLSGWQGRPVYVAGFDDLTEQQLELLVKLGEQTDVTIALTHEVGNPSMAVTENLLGRLENRGATVRQTTTRETDQPSEPRTHAPLLLEVERDFKRQVVPASLDPESGAVTVMHSSGQRGEAEGVAARIARLVADGVEPDEIAIAVSSPASEGKRFRDALREYDIPVTLESETPAPETAVGRSILALIRAVSPSGTAADYLRYLRGPTGSDLKSVDWLEYKVVRAGTATAREAAAIFRSQESPAPPGWDDLIELKAGDSGAAAISATCELLAENLLVADQTSPPGDATVIEVQMSKAIAKACDELEAIGDKIGLEAIAEALRSGAVKTWAIPTQGTIRISSPYSLRAKRFEHLFIVSLQESSLTGADRSGPFLNADGRKAVGLPEFVDPELQELYLFYSCLSVPTDGLWLSSRVADDSGKAEHPSPLVAAVEQLFPAGTLRRHGRRAEQIVFALPEAPSRSELVRSLATSPDPSGALGPDLGLNETDREALDARLSKASKVELSTRTLSSLSCPASLEALAQNLTFSATALEAYRTCQYRWFIERALKPQRFGPAPEHMANGSLVHATLKEIYDDRPGRIPRPADVEEWIEAVVPTVERLAGDDELGLGTDSAAHRVVRRRAANAIIAFLQREALREDPHFLPFQTEAGFGLEDEPVDMGGWQLRGSIDRIDVAGDPEVGRTGVIFDYKTGRSGVLPKASIAKQKKLQLQLYMKVLQKRWKITPVAALYIPVYRGKAKDLRGRGFADGDMKDQLAYLDCYSNDLKGDLHADIDEAVAEASRTVADIVAGKIEHDPLTCVKHFNHAAVPDWAPETAPEGPPKNG